MSLSHQHTFLSPWKRRSASDSSEERSDSRESRPSPASPSSSPSFLQPEGANMLSSLFRFSSSSPFRTLHHLPVPHPATLSGNPSSSHHRALVASSRLATADQVWSSRKTVRLWGAISQEGSRIQVGRYEETKKESEARESKRFKEEPRRVSSFEESNRAMPMRVVYPRKRRGTKKRKKTSRFLLASLLLAD